MLPAIALAALLAASPATAQDEDEEPISTPAPRVPSKITTVYSTARDFEVAVRRKREGDEKSSELKLGLGQELLPGDVVRTGEGQSAAVDLSDRSTIILGEDSAVVLRPTLPAEREHGAIELDSGTLFVHVAGTHRERHPFLVFCNGRIYAAEAGDFEMRVAPKATLVYSISSYLSVVFSLDRLESPRLPPRIDEGYFAKIDDAGIEADTYVRTKLFAFESGDNAFDEVVRKLRESRFPLPVADPSTEGGGGISYLLPPTPLQPAVAIPFSAQTHYVSFGGNLYIAGVNGDPLFYVGPALPGSYTHPPVAKPPVVNPPPPLPGPPSQ